MDGVSDTEVCISNRCRIGRCAARSDAAARHLLPGRHPGGQSREWRHSSWHITYQAFAFACLRRAEIEAGDEIVQVLSRSRADDPSRTDALLLFCRVTTGAGWTGRWASQH